MASARVLKLVLLVVVCTMVVVAPVTNAAVACNQVISYLTPCVNYVLGGSALTQQCCNGVQTLYNAARSTPDRQAVCRCLKQTVQGYRYSSGSAALAAGLPGRCGVNIPYKIDPSTDCNKVQ